MRWTVFIKEYNYHGEDNWFWKTLCVIFDSEALGLLERLIAPSGFSVKAGNLKIQEDK
mgnify:CR=1 FL=1